jgi:acetyl-CoA carboxylase biotin carboxyl carrier protein
MPTKFDLDEKLIRKLADLLKETGLTEIEFEFDQQRIRVSRQSGGSAVQVTAPAPAVAAPSPAPAAGGKPANAVNSPMVGTVYTSPEPGKPPFVKVGDRVKEGQTLLIVEAMKVMNALPSPRTGTVTQVLVSDGQPVEFGEPLLVIE